MSRLPLAAAALASLLAAVRAEAAAFSWEISGVESRREPASDVDEDRSAVSATYYAAEVDDGGGPYALAAFYDPVTHVTFGASRDETTTVLPPLLPPLPVSELEVETDEYSLSGRYVLRDSRWYAGGRYSTQYVEERPATGLTSSDAKVYGVLVGKYLGPKTTLSLVANESKRTSENVSCFGSLLCSLTSVLTTTTTTDEVALEALHVRRFRNLTYAISGRASETGGQAEFRRSTPTLPGVPVIPPGGISIGGPVVGVAVTGDFDLPDVRVYSVGAELFPTPRIGVSVGYSTYGGDSSPADDAYDLGASWFVTHHVALRFAFTRQRYDGVLPTEPADSSTVTVIGRF